MKSILEEGSSIFEAIEKGWKKAGKPKNFSVKILEEPKKNFFGLTVRSAKVGIFFDEHMEQFEVEQPIKIKEKGRVPEKKMEPKKEIKPIKEFKGTRPEEEKIDSEKPFAGHAPWTPQMVQDVNQWLKKTFDLMNLSNINFAIEPKHLFLRIQFEKSIYNETAREKRLFSSLATLILQMLKNKYKRPLKGYKIILLGITN